MARYFGNKRYSTGSASASRERDGQSLIEALIGISIIIFSISFAAIIILGGQEALVDRENTMQARALVEEGIDGASAVIKDDWDNISDGAHGLTFASGIWQFSGTSDTVDEFTREITVTTLDEYEKEIRSVVSWQKQGKEIERVVELITLITDWEYMVELGGLTGDWGSPRTAASFGLGAGRQGTDVRVQNSIIYLSTEATSQAQVELYDLSIIDASNINSLQLLGELDVGGADILSLDLEGDYVYAVTSDDDEEFLIINVSNPSAPFSASTINLDGTDDALTVFYDNGFAYIGRETGTSSEFAVIDVSNPINPQVVSELSGVGEQINDLYILNDLAFLATEDTSRGLIVLDIGNPYLPTFLSSLNVGEALTSVHFQREPKLAVGGDSFYMIDVSIIDNMTIWGSVDVGKSIWDITTVGKYVFLGNETANTEFIMIDAKNPTNMQTVSEFNYPQVARGVDYEGNYVYVAVRSNDALRIITSGP